MIGSSIRDTRHLLLSASCRLRIGQLYREWRKAGRCIGGVSYCGKPAERGSTTKTHCGKPCGRPAENPGPAHRVEPSGEHGERQDDLSTSKSRNCGFSGRFSTGFSTGLMCMREQETNVPTELATLRPMSKRMKCGVLAGQMSRREGRSAYSGQ